MDIRDERLRQKICREMGPEVQSALQDPEVAEVMLNPDGTLWVERLGQGMTQVGTMTPQAAEAFLASVAASLDTIINRDQPIVEGLLPPVVEKPTFSIRKRASVVFTLQDYIEAGSLDETHADILRQAVMQRRNILVVGGTGSGKTTLVNALIACMVERCPEDRLVILEDTSEIQS